MKIVCNNALEYIESFEDNSFDLIFLDPDYQDWDNLVEQGLIEKSIRKLKPTGNILCFTKQPFDFNLRNSVDKFFRREFAWTFENGGAWCSKKMPLISTQKIYWLTKTKDFYFNPRTGQQYSEATRDFKRSVKVFGDYAAEGRNFKKSEEGTWIRDHLHFNKPNSGAIPAKPQKLVEILIRCFSPDDGVILDPFAGSGIIPITAEVMGRESFGCEIDFERTMLILDKWFGYEQKGNE